MGASSLQSFVSTLPCDTGIDLFDENYAISAGSMPATVTLVACGQDASLVTAPVPSHLHLACDVDLLSSPIDCFPTVARSAVLNSVWRRPGRRENQNMKFREAEVS